MKIEVNIEKKHAYAIMAILVVGFSMVGVMSAAPPGALQWHPISEVDFSTGSANGNLDMGGHNIAGVNRIDANTFYDAGDTNYLVDPAGTSKFKTINLGGVSRSSWPSGGITSESDTLQSVTDRGKVTSQDIISKASVRAAIFYDYDDTSYSVNPNSVSKFKTINLGGVSKSSWPSLTCTTVTGPLSACASESKATCPSGYTLTGGGSLWQSSCGGDEKYRFVVENYPSGNSWISKIEFSTNKAYAVCCKIA